MHLHLYQGSNPRRPQSGCGVPAGRTLRQAQLEEGVLVSKKRQIWVGQLKGPRNVRQVEWICYTGIWITGTSRGLGDAGCFLLPSNGPFLLLPGAHQLAGRATCPLLVARMFGNDQNDLVVLSSSLSPFQPEHNWGQCSRSGTIFWQSLCLGMRAVLR